MAVTTKTASTTWLAKGVHSAAWTFTGASQVGSPLGGATLPDKTVHVRGTFAGSTLTIQGTNSAPSVSKWHTLNDPSQNALAFTTSGIEQILENPRFIRPRATTSMSVVITVISQRAPR